MLTDMRTRRFRALGPRCAILLLALLAMGAAGEIHVAVAARAADWDLVRALVKQNVDVNARAADGSTALLWASYRDQREIADLLIRAGASPDTANDLGVTPLWAAAENGSAAM